MNGEQQVIATVSRVNNYIKRLLESKIVLNNLWVKGEISNYKRHSSGHVYLTLKDECGVLKAVMFRAAASCLKFTPSDGMKIIAKGRISVYEAGGAYQLYIDDMIPDGVGVLYQEYERLKKQLENEGLFDISLKKEIPHYPSKIGVITAPTGAAVRDIINIVTRRYPLTEIVIYPALVQGTEAKESIVEAIKYFNDMDSVDVLIVGRGGGSIEDLWAFNEECVARAIFSSHIPVISAVGHETDFTISDFVADLRAPTPSAAAEMSVPSILELQKNISISFSRMFGAIKTKIDLQKQYLKRFVPKNPEDKINELSQSLDMNMQRIENILKLKVEKNKGEWGRICGKLNALSPLNTLSRGYSIPIDENGNILRKSSDFVRGKIFVLKLSDGNIDCIAK